MSSRRIKGERTWDKTTINGVEYERFRRTYNGKRKFFTVKKLQVLSFLYYEGMTWNISVDPHCNPLLFYHPTTYNSDSIHISHPSGSKFKQILVEKQSNILLYQLFHKYLSSRPYSIISYTQNFSCKVEEWVVASDTTIDNFLYALPHSRIFSSSTSCSIIISFRSCRRYPNAFLNHHTFI